MSLERLGTPLSFIARCGCPAREKAEDEAQQTCQVTDTTAIKGKYGYKDGNIPFYSPRGRFGHCHQEMIVGMS